MSEQDKKREAVFLALGAASMCWDPIPVGVFESERAVEIGEELLKELDNVRAG